MSKLYSCLITLLLGFASMDATATENLFSTSQFSIALPTGMTQADSQISAKKKNYQYFLTSNDDKNAMRRAMQMVVMVAPKDTDETDKEFEGALLGFLIYQSFSAHGLQKTMLRNDVAQKMNTQYPNIVNISNQPFSAFEISVDKYILSFYSTVVNDMSYSFTLTSFADDKVVREENMAKLLASLDSIVFKAKS